MEGTEELSGYIVLEYEVHPDDTRSHWYTFYESDGTFWEAFSVTGEIPLSDLYAGQSGVPHYHRAS
ncbi:MAG: hypothetical protein MJ071_09430 [Oscillospiraceae bacterium]|nr:hypothetical protein [Oscillospiraceae bacterium]